jgi:two-component sensor histidine kinase
MCLWNGWQQPASTRSIAARHVQAEAAGLSGFVPELPGVDDMRRAEGPRNVEGHRLARVLQFLCAAAIVMAAAFTLVLLNRSSEIADRLDASTTLNEQVRVILDLARSATAAQQQFAASRTADDMRRLTAALAEAEEAAAAFDNTTTGVAQLKDLVKQHLAWLSQEPGAAGSEAIAQHERQLAQISAAASSVTRGQGVAVLTAASSVREVRRRTLLSIFGILLAAILFGTLSALIDRKYVADVQRARAALETANAELEIKIAERTGQLATANEDLMAQNERIEALLADMNHRIGNSLQFVATFLRMQERSSDQDAVKQALSSAGDRVMAIASAQRRLRLSDDHELCRADTLLSEFIEDLKPLFEAERPISIHFEAEPVTIPGRDAVSLCVAVGELLTNAAKYAFPGRSGGTIHMNLHYDAGGDHIVVEVSDDGIGLPDGVADAGDGLGLKLVDSMIQSIGATLAHATGTDRSDRPGSRYTITLPVAPNETAELA